MALSRRDLEVPEKALSISLKTIIQMNDLFYALDIGTELQTLM